MKVFCLIFGILACTSQALPEERFMRRQNGESRIVGGFQTAIETFPYQISLLRNGYHICGGSIIGSKWILTAAHCVNGWTAPYFTVRVGSSNNKFGGYLVAVKQIIQHENFNRFTIDFDYALIEVAYAIPRTKKIQTISHPSHDEELPDNVRLAVSGWGDTKSDAESDVILRAANVPHVNHAKCNEAYAAFGGITEQMMCAGDLVKGGRDACQGDSGGPLAGNKTLYGVVSWGFDCASPGYPGVYAKVSVVRNWIKTKTGI